jgi:hypothetical protein
VKEAGESEQHFCVSMSAMLFLSRETKKRLEGFWIDCEFVKFLRLRISKVYQDKEYLRLFVPVKVKDEISSLSSRGFDSDW